MIKVQKSKESERMRILAGLEDSRKDDGLLKESVVPKNSILKESTVSNKYEYQVSARVMRAAKKLFGEKACDFIAHHMDVYLDALKEDYCEEGDPGFDNDTSIWKGVLDACRSDSHYLDFLWDNGVEVDGEVIDMYALEDMDGGEESDDEELGECGDGSDGSSDMLDEEGYTDDEDGGDFDTSFEDDVVNRASRDKKARRAAEKDDPVDDLDDDPGFVDPEDMDDDEDGAPKDTKMGKASGADIYNQLQHSDSVEIYADDEQLAKYTLNGNPRRIAYLNQQLRQAQKKANYEETKVYLCFDRGTYRPKFFKPRDERDLVAVITPDGTENYD